MNFIFYSSGFKYLIKLHEYDIDHLNRPLFLALIFGRLYFITWVAVFPNGTDPDPRH